MYLLIISLPLICCFFFFFFTSFISKKGVIVLSLTNMLLTVLCSWIIFYEIILCNSICSIKLIPWMTSNLLVVSWGFIYDNLTATMLVVITNISFLVHLYSTSYMKEDPHLPRFMSYLSLFTFFMLILVTADNFIQMFVGWEGVGLASYLLINFWHTRILANKAAMKAIIINRIGDLGLSLGIASCFYCFATVDFNIIFNMTPYILNESFFFFNQPFNKIDVIAFFIFIGAVGKSAQIGLHTWLPDAMEGPTPVSALIHAATMVTAGVFVLLRFSPLLEYTENMLTFISIMGGLTAFMAATIGVVQNDLKKVIAYSTCSQLGYMVFSIGLSNYSVSLFHLMNHAFFKALLFLSAGSVIHAMSDEQDMRKMGGLIKIVPVTYSMLLIGSLSLAGFPFLTGFYSKDAILELTYSSFYTTGFFVYWLGTISAFFTSFYSIRLLYFTFLGKPNSNKKIINHAHESDYVLLTPLLILGIGSIFIGFIAKELYIGANVNTWVNTFLVLPWHDHLFNSEFLVFSIKLIPVIFSTLGGLTAFFFYNLIQYNWSVINSYKLQYPFYHFLSLKWYFDEIYLIYVSRFVMNFGYKTSFKLLDRGLFEYLGPFGITLLIKKLSNNIVKLQTGLIYHYIFCMLIGTLAIILFLLVPNYVNFTIYLVYLYIIIFNI